MLSIIKNSRCTGRYLWVLVSMLLIVSVSSAQTTFSDEILITNQADWATSVFSIDLDGDGDNDVLSASYYDDKIAWYENADGLGSFGPQQVITGSAEYARSVFSADLDGDGDNDVLSASNGDNKIAWYENTDGLGSFGPQQVITTSANGAQSVFSVDLDGDGDNDVLSASYHDNKIAWYENTDGLGSFGPQQVITTSAGGATFVFSADLDLDGDNDVLSASVLDNKIAWYENSDGLGSFGPQQIITTSAYGALSVFSADLDGDGDNDVLSASDQDDKIAWYRNELYTSVSPQKHPQSVPDKYALFQNYPNPFNPVTTISYDVPVQGIVRVDIYNVLGQKTVELLNGIKPAGRHQMIWDARDLPSGIYFVRMEAPDYRQVRKVVLLK